MQSAAEVHRLNGVTGTVPPGKQLVGASVATSGALSTAVSLVAVSVALSVGLGVVVTVLAQPRSTTRR